MAQAKVQSLNFAAAWYSADLNQRHELQRALFPTGLVYSHKFKYFEAQNTQLMALWRN